MQLLLSSKSKFTIIVLLFACNSLFSQQIPYYKHNISLQVNPYYHELDNIINPFWGIRNDPRGLVINIRYGYRIHKNIIVGGEIRYENEKWDMNQVMYGDYPSEYSRIYNRLDIGIYSRFFFDKIPVVKPFADVGMAYRYQHSWYIDYKTNSTTELGKFTENNLIFMSYITAGVSILIWNDRFNLDLMAKYPILSSFVLFSWKIGYNFNCEKK